MSRQWNAPTVGSRRGTMVSAQRSAAAVARHRYAIPISSPGKESPWAASRSDEHPAGNSADRLDRRFNLGQRFI